MNHIKKVKYIKEVFYFFMRILIVIYLSSSLSSSKSSIFFSSKASHPCPISLVACLVKKESDLLRHPNCFPYLYVI